jgi:hypothetical protein
VFVVGAGIDKLAEKTANYSAGLRAPMRQPHVAPDLTQVTQFLGMAFRLLQLPSDETEEKLPNKSRTPSAPRYPGRSDVNRPLRLGFCPLSGFKASEMDRRERYKPPEAA